MTPAATPAAIYRRVSTNHQDGSLELQEHKVQGYATFKDFSVSADLTFADPDTSGRTPMLERDGGRALMNRLAYGDVKHVIIAKLDRLGRNVRDALSVIDAFKQMGVTLHITDMGGESLSTQGHVGHLILTILLAVAQWEVEEIRDRVTKQLRQRFDDHQLTGNVPFGHDVAYVFADGHHELSPRALCWGGKDTPPEPAALTLVQTHGALLSKPLRANPAERDWIFTMVAQRTAGQSYKAIADWLNANGCRTKLGRTWQCGSVAGVLGSRHTARLVAQSAAATPLPLLTTPTPPLCSLAV